MSNYALIKNGIVENIVVWDGEGDFGLDYETYHIPAGVSVGPGYAATKNFDEWTFEAPVIIKNLDQIASDNKYEADTEYGRATLKINALNEQIEDEDYTKTTEINVKASLEKWTAYRKALRFYISADDNHKTLPIAPDA
jgi:hypothetical protein